MKKTFLLSVALLIAISVFAQPGTLTGIQVSQRTDGSGFVDIYFNLSGSAAAYNMSLEASFDAGSSYQPVPAAHLSGDVTSVSPGNNKHLVWDGFASFPDVYTENAKLKISASSYNDNPYVIGPDGYIYTLTTIFYSETDDLNQVAINEYGAAAVVADWNDLKTYFSSNIAGFLDGIGIYSDSQHNSAMLKRNGQFFWESGNRQYFMRRFDGSVPGHWLVHDHISNRTLCLGSWYNLDQRVLIKYPAN